MTYRVVWKNSALQALAAIYTEVLEQGGAGDSITRSTAKIDALLQTDPADRGESREDEERILCVRPLAVYFEVHEEEGVVIVLSVRRFAPI